MNAQQAEHPTHDRLRAYGLGEPIDTAAAETIGQHLETCADCRRVVAELSADPFLDRLRAVGTPEGTPSPERPVDGLARSIGHPRTPPTSAGDTLPPELTDHPNYEVIRELGRGGMGVVYLAHNRLMDRPEVLKVMNKDLVNKPGAADRFLREMRSAAKLAHPNVVRAYSADRLGDTLMFAMEYVEGNDLAGLVKARGPLPVVNACYYAQQVAAGLQHAFENGMVHRDIKPANLILARAGKKHTVKILDFGLAKMKGSSSGGELTRVGAMMGTPQYMAPEQWRDAASADIRADIYSLGCTLYVLLTGRPPFDGNTEGLLWKHLQALPEPLPAVRPEVPESLAAVVARMMAKDPAARYQTPVEAARALAPFVKPGSKPAPTAGPTAPEAKSTPAVVAPAAAPTHADSRPVWETIGEVSVSPVLAQPPAPGPSSKRRWLWPAVACGTILAALLIAGAAGAFRAKTPNGTIVVENVPADADVEVNGEKVTMTRNGETVTLAALKDGPYKLRVLHGGKELKLNEAEVTIAGKPVRVRVARAAAPPAPEFVSLFNGKDLSGWFFEDPRYKDQWSVVDGVISAKGAPSDIYHRNWLLSEREYSDFVLRFEYLVTSGDAGSQVGYRCERGETARLLSGQLIPFHPNCLLIAENGPSWEAAILRAPKVGVTPTIAGATKPAGEWYRVEVQLSGRQLRITINGRQIHTQDLDRIAAMTTPDSIPGYKSTKGHVGFLSVKPDEVRFKDVRIKDLSPVKAATK